MNHATQVFPAAGVGVLLFWLLLVVAVGGVVYSLKRRLQLVAAGKRGVVLGQWGRRLWDVVVYVLGQRRMFSEPVAGVMHALIFWGFCVFLLRSVSLVYEGASGGHELPFLVGGFAVVYGFTKDVFAVLVLVGVAIAAFRRAVTRPARLEYSADAWFILAMIALLMVTDITMDAPRIAAQAPGEWQGAVVSKGVAAFLGGFSAGSLEKLYVFSWWLHLGVLFVFANYLPYSKHFHVYLSLPNVLLRPLEPAGKLAKMDLEHIEEGSALGAAKVTDFTWKQLLDLYTCTECGRCTVVCPTTITGKPLIPRDLTIDLRNHLTASTALVAKGKIGELPDVVGPVINPETVWACTTCRWCEESCPLFISYIDKIVEMRRHLVLEKADFPSEAEAAFRGMETAGNPWQLPAESRGDWAKGLEVPRAAEGVEFEYLFWVGCAGAFDDQGRRTSVALVKLLQAAGVRFAILGAEERCTGDAARRLGNEYLFQMLAQENVETLNRYGVRKIVTNCPHCLHTLRHEYPDFGGHFQVLHGTQLVAQLLQSGRLRLTKEVRQQLTFHDPCYLGRTNGEFDAPRAVLHAIPGLRVREAPLSRERAMCCGAGGGRMWLEEKLGSRINQTRLQQLEQSGCHDVAVACPFCAIMVGNAQGELGRETAKTLDVVQLAAQALGEA
ncbi:MAG: heterodisulfide reductase-related iron-sulfur binding cluster [Thermoanaerobaculum sp.]|nr:heterodisulfide reductase-related iron-sulfur binding cluster [Thermoanaerobaculum sp.]MDW7967044.1 (Fe-S)-binding protein [Thermoanaerobaculum sp.]